MTESSNFLPRLFWSLRLQIFRIEIFPLPDSVKHVRSGPVLDSLRMSSLVRIGVDVGGTNTDAVVLQTSASGSSTRGVLAFHKTRSTPQVTDGIETAIRAVLDKSEVPRHRVQCLVIGTTHFINAVIENDRKRLVRLP